MKRKRLWVATLAVTVVATATVATGVIVLTAREEGEHEGLVEGDVLPGNLAAHLERLHEAIPGNGGEPGEGPGSAAEAEFRARAYPDNTIAVSDMNAARSSFTAVKGHSFPAGKNPGTWVSVGPSNALYPFTPLRNSGNYVPNAYTAGGRTTSIAMANTCVAGNCRVYVTPAGGGVWRTDDALAAHPSWKYLGGPLGINAAGSVTIDPNDSTGNTVYAGTGEANICGSGCVAGVGLYKSTDGGNTWTGPLGKAELGGKGIGSVAIKPGSPNTIYAATTTALRGMSSVCCSGVTRPVPGAAKWGLYKSTDGGASWVFIHNGSTNVADCTGTTAEFNNTGVCSPRGVRQVALDPVDPNTVYAASYARGVWRSSDGGATWVQIKPSLNASVIQTRPAIAVTTLANGKTRMYVHEGNAGTNPSHLFRSDDVRTGAPVFLDLSSSSPKDDGYATYDQCDGQCWYDIYVYTPKGNPDIVYTGGSYAYGETGGISNGRGVVLSTDAGVTGTDMTMDGTDPVHPNGLHPDQHAIVTNPNNPFQFIATNDGGAMRSSGSFSSVSSWCDSRGLNGNVRSRCQQLLSRVPSRLDGINEGLNTLQFQSLSVSQFDSTELQGGTQDNGTWENFGGTTTWLNTMIGDGGQSGFDVANPSFRFHSFFDTSPEVNFDNGDTADWIWVADPMYGTGGQFYSPIISDPIVAKTMFSGAANVFRTKTQGLGSMTIAQAQQHCNTWTGDFSVTCGDWVQVATPSLTDAARGDRSGGSVAAIERTKADASTAWAATTAGRVFVSKNVNAEPAGGVSWARIDKATTPNRFVSSIHVDPANGNHAWVSYSGFDANTPTTPGHVFEVTYNPATHSATWVDRSYDLGDQPVTDLVRDDAAGDLYSSSDFGVMRLTKNGTSWTLAGTGMPAVEVAGLTIPPNGRALYAASHGLSAWKLALR
jgi:hypothetical protein